MTRRDRDVRIGYAEVLVLGISRRDIGDDAGYGGTEGCTSHQRFVSILRRINCIRFVYSLLYAPCSYLPWLRLLPYANFNRVDIQVILRILGKESIIA